MTNNDEVLDIIVDGGRLEQVDSFMYFGSTVTNDADCAGDVKSRLAMGMVVMVKLAKIWKKRVSTSKNYA
jgi:hypothetical protein